MSEIFYQHGNNVQWSQIIFIKSHSDFKTRIERNDTEFGSFSQE